MATPKKSQKPHKNAKKATKPPRVTATETSQQPPEPREDRKSAAQEAYARAQERGIDPPPDRKPGEWEHDYLTALVQTCGQYTASAERAGVAFSTVWRKRKGDPQFAADEVECLKMGQQVAESEARRRAVEGVERVKFDKHGAVIGYEREYSDTLLLRLLERYETGSWRPRQQIDTTTTVAFDTAADRRAALERARQEMRDTGDTTQPPPGT